MIVESSTAKKTTSKSWAAPDPGDDREGREDDGHRPAQPPAESDGALGPREARRQGRDGDRDRARDEDEHEREHRPAHGDVVEPLGKTSRPRATNIASCAHPRQPLVEGRHRLLGGDAGRAEREPGQVDGEEARAVQGVSAAVGQRGHGQRRDRVQPRRGQRSRAAAPTPPPPRPPADGQADADLAHEEHGHVRQPVVVLLEPLDEARARAGPRPDR